MTLSIVITTYNRSAVLKRLLTALDSGTQRDFQVVVAVDGSTDDTEAMLATLKPGYDLKWVNTHCPEYGLAVARNHGILAADGRVVAILDDDSLPEPGFLAAHLRDARSGVITGGPRIPSDPAAERMMWKLERLYELPPLTPLTIDRLRREWPNAYLIENNVSMLREDWIACGLFSERLKIYGYIGQEFFGRAEYLGLQYQFSPEAAIVHHGEIEGDNGLTRTRKTRQTAASSLLRATLMRPRHFDAQIAWAKARAEGRGDIPLPPWRMQAALALPGRYLMARARDVRRAVRSAVKR